MASNWSRNFAAFSNCSSLAASFISFSTAVVISSGDFLAKKLAKLFANVLCSSALIQLTHGAAHFPISPSKHCRLFRCAVLKLDSVQVRTG